jgi:gamma-glutamylcyclotransferase (GGCT)/AIG2-like uncharacterized protein YtfP
MSNPNHTLIVYGSLAPGESNHHIVSHIKGEWKKATIYGHLEKIGWGAAIGYLGFTPDNENGQAVNAYVFQSEDLPKHWAILDEFEGEEYVRVVIEYMLEDGDGGLGYVYAVNSLEM